jgi:hypothetical protein
MKLPTPNTTTARFMDDPRSSISTDPLVVVFADVEQQQKQQQQGATTNSNNHDNNTNTCDWQYVWDEVR